MISIKSKLTIQVIGLNIVNLIKELSISNIELISVEKLAYNTCLFTINLNQYRKCKKILEKGKFDFKIVKSRGVLSWLWKIRFRFCLVIGFIVSIAIVCLLSNKLFFIEVNVEGDTNFKQEIYSLLEQNNLKIGSDVNRLDTLELENMILKEYNNVSFVSVEQKGVMLNIFVKTIEEKYESKNASIVAKYDGVIKKIDFGSGKLNVNVGDVVTAGQVLVESGNVGDTFLEASAKIIADCYVTGVATGVSETTSLKRSGNIIIQTNYYFGDKLLFQKGQNNDYQYFEIEKKIIDISANIMPIKKEVIYYYELKETLIQKNVEDLIEELKKIAYNNSVIDLEEGTSPDIVHYDVLNEERFYKVICVISHEMDITKRIIN